MTEHATTYKELRRTRDDRMIGGVCSGLGRYFDVNPAFYRVGFVVLALLGGAGILIYGAALLVMPNEDEADSVATQVLRDHRQHPWALVALAVLAVAALSVLSHATLWPHGDAAWILLLVAGGIIYWSRRRDAGAGTHVLRTILIVLGALVALVLVVGAIFMSVSGVHLSRGVGDRAYEPGAGRRRAAAGLQARHRVTSAGSHRRPLPFRGDEGGGRRRRRLPRGDEYRRASPCASTVRPVAGKVQVFNNADDGHHSNVTTTSVVGGGQPLLLLHAHVGSGKVEVRRALR